MSNILRTKPDWVIKLEAEPCHCVSCSWCGGSGTIYIDMAGHVVRSTVDDTDSPESCDECSGGIVETCDRCEALIDFDNNQEPDV